MTRFLVALLVVLISTTSIAQVINQITDVRVGVHSRAVLVADGTRLVSFSSSNPVGANSEHRFQVFRWNLQDDSVVQLTDLPEGVIVGSTFASFVSPGITPNGEKVLFASKSNVLGTNPDRSAELFLLDTVSENLSQLTSTSALDGEYGSFQISADGLTLVFRSTVDLIGSGGVGELPRVFAMDSSGANLRELTPPGDYGFSASVSGNGSRVAYSGLGGVRVVNSDATGNRLVGAGGSFVEISRTDR